MREDDPRIEDIIAVVAGRPASIRSGSMPATPVADLGISSLDLIETIFKLESRFGIEIPNDGPLNNTGVTVGALIDEVLALLDGAARGKSQAKTCGLAVPNGFRTRVRSEACKCRRLAHR